MTDRYVTVAVAAAAITLGATTCAALVVGGLISAGGVIAGKRRFRTGTADSGRRG